MFNEKLVEGKKILNLSNFCCLVMADLLAKLSVEMTRLLGDDDNATFNPATLNGEKKQALVNLESLLIASSQIGDESVKASEAVEGIVLEKFRLLKVDYSNLSKGIG